MTFCLLSKQYLYYKINKILNLSIQKEIYYDIKNDNKYSYKHSLGNYVSYTYSEKLVDFIVDEIKKNPSGFVDSLKQK